LKIGIAVEPIPLIRANSPIPRARSFLSGRLIAGRSRSSPKER